MTANILLLLLFGYSLTNQIRCQAQETGGEVNDDSKSEGDESSEFSENESESDTSSDLLNTNIAPNYAIDYFYINSQTTVPWPYPVETCVLTSLISTDTTPYVMYSCSLDNTELTQQGYSDDSCSTTSGPSQTWTSSSFIDAGDINSFVCGEDDNYSFKITLNCDGDESINTYAVPGVCFRDNTDTKNGSFSNYFQCTNNGTDIQFDIYTASSFCGLSTDADTTAYDVSVSTDLEPGYCISFWPSLVTGGDAIFAEVVVGDSLKCYTYTTTNMPSSTPTDKQSSTPTDKPSSTSPDKPYTSIYVVGSDAKRNINILCSRICILIVIMLFH